MNPPEAAVIAAGRPPPPHGHVRALVHSIGAVLLVGEVAFVSSLLLDGLVLPIGWWDRWCHPALNLGAAGLVLLRAGAGTRRRGPWAVVAAGLLCSAAGDLYYSIALFGTAEALSPSVADAFWLLSYPAYYIGLVLLVRASSRQFHQSMWLDGIVAGLGFSAIGALVFGPIAADARPGTAVLIPLAYPSADVLLVSLLIGVVAARGWRLSGPWVLLAVGATMNAVADTGFLLLVAGGRYADGSLVDAVWSGAYLVLAVAAWRDQHDDEPVRLEGGRVLVVPVLVTVTSLLVLLGDAARPVPLAAQLLAAGAISAVLVRTALTFREVASLAETRHAARTDDLTGLANRRDFYRQVTAATTAGTPTARTVVMLIDLDHFKDVNDSLGHQVGDELLVQVGRRLRERVRAADTVARLGGDEFAILLHDIDLDDAEHISAALSDRLREPFAVGPSMLRISGSIGIAAHPDHAEDVQGLLRCADFAMYAAKSAGSLQVYDPASSEHARRSLQTVQELRAAIDASLGRWPVGPAGTLQLQYQPKLDLRSGRVQEFEVLVRWNHPRLGVIGPEEFLPLVERAGLMASLTDVVLSEALAQCRTWRESGRELAVAVNVSATSLGGLEFASRIGAALVQSRLPPSALILEITESVIMKDRDRGLDALHAIRSLGVRIAVDDFGTGYSSLAYLHELPVDELKLDRSFVARMVSDPRAAAIVTSTIGLAHSLGMPMVAEGVETLAALKMLTAAGCDYGQGYLIARPLRAHEVGGWLDKMARPAQPALHGPV